jgi:hypothetical protein
VYVCECVCVCGCVCVCVCGMHLIYARYTTFDKNVPYQTACKRHTVSLTD